MRLTKLFFSMLIFCSIVSCKNDDIVNNNENKLESASNSISLNENDKQALLKRFSEILSKAIYDRKEVREFLKAEALKKIDNGYNIFYPLIKNRDINGTSFRNILAEYSGMDELNKIEQNVPLLNIHIPEFGDLKVNQLDVSDEETPVLFDRKLYFNGQVVDSIAANEIPYFNLFVVTESSSIRLRNGRTRSSSELALNEKYEYIDRVFNPLLTHTSTSKTRYSEYEKLTSKYADKGVVRMGDIDPLLIDAFRNTENDPRLARHMMYYNLKSPKDSAKAIRTDIRDCIFRFKLSGDAFLNLEDVASAHGRKPLFYHDTDNLINELTRKEILDRLLTGRAFWIQFKIQNRIGKSKYGCETMNIYASPDKLFNLRISRDRRHPTFFRHTKFTYAIDKNGVKSKWYYPLENGHDSRFERWDITKEPLQKQIHVYLINPNKGGIITITNSYSATYLAGVEFGTNVSVPINEKVTVGVNGKLNLSKTVTKSMTEQYTIPQHNIKLGNFNFDYFEDYPIAEIGPFQYYPDIPVILSRKGKGLLETTIMPISDKFYRRIHNN